MNFLTFALLLWSIPFARAAPAEYMVQVRQACSTGISSASAARVLASFSASGVIPTLIPTLQPKVEVHVTYPSGEVDLGKQTNTLGKLALTTLPDPSMLIVTSLRPTDTLTPPSFFFTAEPGAPPTASYSFFLVDPDVPGPNGLPVVGQPRLNFLHWYISGVKPCGQGNGTTVTIYELPTPVSPGEQHRYTFLVYREPPAYQPQVIGAQVRPAFDLLGYTTRGGLGTPIGGNFFNQSITNGLVPS